MSQYRKPHTHTHTHAHPKCVWADILMCGCQPTEIEMKHFSHSLRFKIIFWFMCNEASTNEVTVGTGKGNPEQWIDWKTMWKKRKTIYIFFLIFIPCHPLNYHVNPPRIISYMNCTRCEAIQRALVTTQHTQSAKSLTNKLLRTIFTNYNNLLNLLYSSVDVPFLIFEMEWERDRKKENSPSKHGQLWNVIEIPKFYYTRWQLQNYEW